MKDNKVNWYVLYVRSGAEERVVEQLKIEFSCNVGSIFIPKKNAIYRRKGQKSEFAQKCFPGYVFIESNKTADVILSTMMSVVRKMKDAYYFLYYGDKKDDIAMCENEQLVMRKLFGTEHTIDISKGFKEGDSVKIISGSLLSFEGIIKRINVSRREAVIALQMFGASSLITVGLEMVEKRLE